jgi:GMP synthase (glutamine-hydrolysing)
VSAPRALAVVHQPDAGPGVFAEAARERGWLLHEWLLPSGEPPPGRPDAYDAVFVFGGAMHTDQEDEHPWLREEKAMISKLLSAGKPIVGMCLGSQLLAEAAGAPAVRADEPEIGWFDVEVTAAGTEDPLVGDLAPGFESFQWHSYRSPLPEGAVALASSRLALQAFRLGDSAWGFQFHAEVSEHDALAWARNYAIDPDAVRIGIDPDVLSSQIAERIDAWNELGRGLCGRFLDLARPDPE